MLQIGCGKADITAFKRGVGMLGYGQHFNTMEEIETPLFARAVALVDNDSTSFCFVNVELAFITPSLKHGVLHLLNHRAPKLGVTDHNLMLTAQHTHSGPGGYSFHCLYNLTTPGFVAEIYRRIVRGITDAIIDAHHQLSQGTITLGRGEFAESDEVGMIRSVRAYNRNPEVREPLTRETAQRGINREMTLLKLTSAAGTDLGCISWFGVHCTNLANDNKRVCSDNKGYAARFFEEAFAKENQGDVLAIFAQGPCGDVSPKFVRNNGHKWQHGKYDGKFPDDIDSAKFNGGLQFEKAIEIYRQAAVSDNRETRIRCFQRVQDFGDIAIDPEYSDGRTDLKTSPGCFGVAFAGGSPVDGPGAPPILMTACGVYARLVKWFEIATSFRGGSRARSCRRTYAAQSRKTILIESVQRVAGTKHVHRTPLPGFLDPAIRNFKRFYLTGAIAEHAWTPQVLPVQLIFLGDIALASFPFEITTIAARRLSASLTALFEPHGIAHVILCPYANAYSGYVTTFEEYQVQMYEAGHTLFGEWTLAALQTAFKRLIEDLPSNAIDYDTGDVEPADVVEVNEDDSLAVRPIAVHLQSLLGD